MAVPSRAQDGRIVLFLEELVRSAFLVQYRHPLRAANIELASAQTIQIINDPNVHGQILACIFIVRHVFGIFL